jgi:DNA polymerase III epsilon subunit-like protein
MAGALVYLDLETTGLTPEDRIAELAALRVDGNREEWLESLVSPEGRGIHPRAAAVNGLGAVDFERAPLFADLAPKLLALLEGAPLVAYNAPFDVRFLQAAFARAGVTWRPTEVVDVLAMARHVWPTLEDHRLETVARALGCPAPSHRARADVEALRAVSRRIYAAAQERLRGAGAR